MNISPHFTYEELTHSDKAVENGIDNTPSIAQMYNLERLCRAVLEPIRALIGYAAHVNSGFRCVKVNALVGGVVGSSHLSGLAADSIFPSCPLTITAIWIKIKDSGIPYDQLIIEHSPKTGSTWIHASASLEGIAPRRQAFALTKRDARVANG